MTRSAKAALFYTLSNGRPVKRRRWLGYNIILAAAKPRLHVALNSDRKPRKITGNPVSCKRANLLGLANQDCLFWVLLANAQTGMIIDDSCRIRRACSVHAICHDCSDNGSFL